MSVDLEKLKDIAEVEFEDIVEEAVITDLNELRIMLTDGSFIDVWFSLKLVGKYSYHWERKALDGLIYRHDNIPHKKWEHIKTFPKHFHDRDESTAVESHIDNNEEKALREFLSFSRKVLTGSPPSRQ
jgi:hypothetical protein